MPNTDREQGRRALERFEQSDLSHQHLRAMRAVGFTDAGQAQEVYDGHGNNDKAVERLAAEAKEVLGGYAREFLGEDRTETEWVQGCDCDTDATEAGIVLDPFAGAGTTCFVAKDLGRRFVGIDLNPDYVALAQRRVGVTVDEPARLPDRDDDQPGLDAFADGGDGDG
jgi:SAM-dependent methyltransferase